MLVSPVIKIINHKSGHWKRRLKRGKRAGVLARLKANADRPPIPSLFLSNVRSLDNKLDLLRLRMSVSDEMRNCAVICLTETWLNDSMPDSAFQLAGRQLFRADRNQLSGKARGGGLCVYINKGWCTNCVVVNALCSEATEQLTVKCRPHYLPREFTAVFVIAVYIAPDANANNALKELHDNISSLQNKHPEAFYVVAGDFNHVNLTNILPRFYQHIDIPTRGNNTLDRVYTNVRDAYRAVPHPHLGLSDHISIMLVPAYHPPLRRSRPTQKTITVWPSDADAVLQDCFGCTDWHVFREAAESEGELDLEDYTSAVLGYISKCVEDVTTTKTVTCYPNQKPWLNGEVRSLLKARDAAFRDTSPPRILGACGGELSASQTIKPEMHNVPKDPSLPEALNKFYARFKDPDTPPSIRLTPTPGEVPLSVTPAEVRRTLRRINPRKSAGPDNIPGRVLRECADQISEVLADIFNVSLTQAAVPTCLKTATIIRVPKSSTVTGLNDYRPIALTPIVTKCFERLVMTHIKATIDVTVDPHQYAYRRNRSTDDAISSVVHTALTHLEQKDSYISYSSLGLRSSLCNNWVLDFLTNRPQSVRIHNLSSSTTILSTGSPQGCVLSPLLFTLLTYDCSPIHPGCHIVKFADDTAVVGCITNSDESGYRQEVEHLEGWCRKNNLCINIKKTKEMIVDFRRGRHAHLPLHVGGSAVEVVSSYRYLGVHLSNNLTWSNNTSSLVRKAHQRLYFLRRLRRAGLGSSVLTSFYRCVVESILCYSINVWHGSCSAADRKALQRVVKAAQRSVGVSLPTTTDIYTSRCRKRATCIMRDPTHPAHSLFVPLPSGRRLRSVKCRTNRLRNSFIPEAVRLLNAT
ncbi:hypothetical protein NFI96_034005 [Prochilodus magdalenae]|nr:hypothetical protein NFI96_034005 [Prochilodus magdalenae]